MPRLKILLLRESRRPASLLRWTLGRVLPCVGLTLSEESEDARSPGLWRGQVLAAPVTFTEPSLGAPAPFCMLQTGGGAVAQRGGLPKVTQLGTGGVRVHI